MVIKIILFLLLFLHVLPEFILQDAAETEQPVPLADEEEQEDLRQGEELLLHTISGRRRMLGLLQHYS